jgi:hypothetical protein
MSVPIDAGPAVVVAHLDQRLDKPSSHTRAPAVFGHEEVFEVAHHPFPPGVGVKNVISEPDELRFHLCGDAFSNNRLDACSAVHDPPPQRAGDILRNRNVVEVAVSLPKTPPAGLVPRLGRARPPL